MTKTLQLKEIIEVGDVCIYGKEDASQILIEIVGILENDVATFKVLKVFEDKSGNGYFKYLHESGHTMNGSYKYMKNITPVNINKEN